MGREQDREEKRFRVRVDYQETEESAGWSMIDGLGANLKGRH